jgi:pilus assembly protein Flp/PilA
MPGNLFGMRRAFARFIEDQSGATAIEYGLVAAGIAVAISASLTMVGCSLTNLFVGIADKLKTG